jgi:hypothetical protein
VGVRMALLSLPAWVDILVNVIGYSGFIAIATWHKSSNEITTGSPITGPIGAESQSASSPTKPTS